MKMKKILKFLLWSGVGLVTAVALLYAYVDWSGTREWKKTEAELLAKGEPLRMEQIIPPPIPDEQNFAFSPFFKGVFEVEKFTENGEVIYRPKYPEIVARMDALRLPLNPNPPYGPDAAPMDIVAWQSYFHAHPEFGLAKAVGDPAEDILTAVNNWKVPMDEIASDLRARPQMRAPFLYDQNLAKPYPHINAIIQVSKLFALRAVAHVRQGRSNEAFDDVESILLLRQAGEPRRMLIGTIVAASVTAIVVPVIQDGLAAHIWNEDQLARLSSKLERLKLLSELSSALRVERVLYLDATRRMQASLGEDIPLPWKKSVVQGLLPNGYLEDNRAAYSRFIQVYLEKVLVPNQERFDVSFDRNYNAAVIKLSDSPRRMIYILSSIGLYSMSSNGVDLAWNSAYVSQARIAIALERHRLMYGSIPENLTALVPEFLTQIPADPIDGKPLRYKKVSETDYRIWSIGYNQKDDGGVAGAKSTEGDWLWTSLPPQ